jgi:hypothetical protein
MPWNCEQVILDTSTYCLPVDYQVLQKCCANEELFAALDLAPQEALSCLGAAVYEVRANLFLRHLIVLNTFVFKSSIIAGFWRKTCMSGGRKSRVLLRIGLKDKEQEILKRSSFKNDFTDSSGMMTNETTSSFIDLMLLLSHASLC